MTELDIHLQQSVPLDLRGVVRGSAVRLFEGWRDAGVPADAAPSVPAGVDPDEVVPDPFAFIAECVDLGFFVPSASARGEPSFVVRSTTRDPGRLEVAWSARLEALDLRLFRALGNVLLARGLDSIQITGVAPDEPDATTVHELPSEYPPAPATTLFAVDYDPPARRLRDRAVRIELADPPSDAALESLDYRLDVWVKLMLLGAFPLPRRSPRDSGVVPELPALVERQVVEQTFAEAFFCDEAAFNVLLCTLDAWSRTVAPIRHVSIR